jgi:hypothetical protein
MSLNQSLKSEFKKSALIAFNEMVSASDFLLFTTESAFDPASYSETPSVEFKARGIIATIPLNKVNGDNIQVGDCIGHVLSDEMDRAPEIGMVVSELDGNGPEYTIYAIEADAADAVYKLYLRRR